ncbi:hypothetical protein SAMN05216577_116142 [Pseudomonas citronellolis]|jgi:hypothetical protein|uniref:Uncharacterized protein n=2 Tax=Pseudomonas TaxID=286 RepID=A0AAQ1HP68_9PSED|nr:MULTISPECIES: hypothetical protein [Pseudomonas]AMO75576.1 hypothetical protein PcP3B5_21330 [Pseudomonas citronellolis]KES25289.1 hypothetical protein FG99_04035 [Pseudomonas sp. AAC]MBB1608874.1 hypothetical protein [Pseudomonas sp. UMC76]MBB1637776.1 hypothetical protein [Pseudomonas sp. UME83]MBH3434566.1 hypothetical protein [Pseudomonas citronellolis]
MAFDRFNSRIAITLGQFTLLKRADLLFDRYSEPYIVSLAIDTSNIQQGALTFNYMPFPKVRQGSTVSMLGDGHLLYGPANPGEYVALSLLMMESDRDLREAGERIRDVVGSKAADLGLKAVMLANPGSAAVVALLKELTAFTAGRLASDGDDELFRTEGAFLRDQPNPYHINRSYRQGNDFIDLELRILPLDAPNGEGATPQTVELA